MGHTDFIAQFTGERRFQKNTGISTWSTLDWRCCNNPPKRARIPPKRRKTLAWDMDSYSSTLQDCVYRANTWKSSFQYFKIPIVLYFIEKKKVTAENEIKTVKSHLKKFGRAVCDADRNPSPPKKKSTWERLWGLQPRGTQVLKLPEQSHMEEVPKPPRPPRPSLLGALLPEGGKCSESSLRKRLSCFPSHVGIAESLMLFPPKACFIQKKKGICSALGILHCCSWGLGPPAWSACLGRPRAGRAGAAARAAPRMLARGAVPATAATFPRRRRRGAGTGPGSALPPW